MLDGLTFGILDNAILIVGAVSGYEIERVLPRQLRVGVGAIAGAGVGNLVSDVVGAAIDPAMQTMILGIGLGCLIPLAIIPAIALWNKSRSAHSPN